MTAETKLTADSSLVLATLEARLLTARNDNFKGSYFGAAKALPLQSWDRAKFAEG
jgi:hypothetical protein